MLRSSQARNWQRWVPLIGLAVVLSGCPDDDVGPPVTPVPTSTNEPDPPPLSAKASVKFKGVDRLVNDFSQALALDKDQLCNEVGLFPCATVHNVALGGVDAYGAGIYKPMETSAVTTPITVDRLALGACMRRGYSDIEAPDQAVIFKGLELSGGKLADVDSEAVGAAIQRLHQRVLLREPSAAEVAHHRGLYTELANSSANPARDWATLSCYSVLTMMESLFY